MHIFDQTHTFVDKDLLYFLDLIKNNLMSVLLIFRSFVFIRRQYGKEKTIQPNAYKLKSNIV